MNRVIIYGATYCSFCIKAKNFFIKNQIKFNWIDTESNEGQEQVLALQSKYNWSTIPMIFVDDRFIGGYTDLMK